MESQAFSRASGEAPLDEPPVDAELRTHGLEVVGVLGVGGSAIVYRAHDARHGRDVAVEVLRRSPSVEDASERFAREIRVAAGLRHAHILPLFDSGTLSDDRLFSVMPVAQGRPLSALISVSPLAIADAVRLVREVAQALGFLHQQGFVHRDIKPENILVEGGHAVLTDFGLTVPMRSRVSEGSGTLPYMGPEALFADVPIDGRADIFSLGVVLYEAVTGHLPFETADAARLMAMRARQGTPRASVLRPDIAPALDVVIARCTALVPEDRYQTAEALDAALAVLSTDNHGVTQRTSSRPREWRGIAAIVLLTVSIGVALAWRSYVQANGLDPQRVVVADLANDTGDSSLAVVGVLAGDMITNQLTNGTTLVVVNAVVVLPSRLQRNVPPTDSVLGASTRALVSSARAGLVVTGAYMQAGGMLEVVAEITDTRSGRILGTAGPVRAKAAAPDSALRVLADSVVSIVRRRYAPPAS